eukprot:TRINITY_DN4499_c0_g2_i1.p1 TRINITY_DN4499_c0_g2~~TRINITY_DN4499_c0_g2_i1.p1  ORF type:complete len:494 (+),score=50.35 TRINITY_DN4499_c0_g2_i1:144-1625(+)
MKRCTCKLSVSNPYHVIMIHVLHMLGHEDIGQRRMNHARESQFLKTNDIDGAQPLLPGYRYSNKESYWNRNDDINGSKPKELHKPLNKTYFHMTNEDIKGSKPQQHKFVTTRSPTNPLTPEYVLPYAEVRVPTPPKFVRDSIDIQDIDGARPNPYMRYKVNRQTMRVDDIEGAKPKPPFYPKDRKNPLDVKDINEFWEFRSQRITNPLDPKYVVPDESGAKKEIGDIDGSHPRQLHPKDVNKTTSFSLRTQDIEGAKSSTIRQEFFRSQERKEFRQTTKTDDVPGAQVGSLKKGVVTNRKTNPLTPAYVLPGLSENIEQTMPKDTISKPVPATREKVKSPPLALDNATFEASKTVEQNDVKFYDGANRITTPVIEPLQSVQKNGSRINSGNGARDPDSNVFSSSANRNIIKSSNSQTSGIQRPRSIPPSAQIREGPKDVIGEEFKNSNTFSRGNLNELGGNLIQGFKPMTTAQKLDQFISKQKSGQILNSPPI